MAMIFLEPKDIPKSWSSSQKSHEAATRVEGAPRGVVLGNVVISKTFLRTRKIMVMHSNERGESVVYILS